MGCDKTPQIHHNPKYNHSTNHFQIIFIIFSNILMFFQLKKNIARNIKKNVPGIK